MNSVSLRSLGRQARNAAQSLNLYAPPGHFYSPSTSRLDRQRQGTWDSERSDSLPGIDLNLIGQSQLVPELARAALTFQPRRWSLHNNTMFGSIDALVLHAWLSVTRPNRIIEIGSGFSTAVMLDAADSIGTTRDITCIEPYPERLNSLLKGSDNLTLRESPVQDVDPAKFQELQAGDLLFIDSTHVAKPGSDVLYLMLEILPTLQAGVSVHVHDIFWPLSYRQDWLVEGRDWTEAYLLRALLTDSQVWRIEWFSDFIWQTQPELARKILPATLSDRPGSIFLRRAA